MLRKEPHIASTLYKMSKNDSQYFIYGCTLAWSLSARSSFIMKYNTDVRCTRDAVAQIGQSLFEVIFEIRFSTNFRRCFFQTTYHVIFFFDRNSIVGIFRENLATFWQNAASNLALVRETTSNGIQMK